MTTQYQPLSETGRNNSTTDAAYAWYLLNRDEISEISDNHDVLQTLRDIESELSLAPGTAERFKAIHDDASSVPENEEERYAATWDAYHTALDSNTNLATLASIYSQRVQLPIYERINANGVFTF